MVQEARERAIVREVVVEAPLAEVWKAWSTSEGAEAFLAPKANIELTIGGAYEITFDPDDESQGTKGLKILSYVPEEMISFQWNAPPDMPNVRKIPTWVTVQLSPADSAHVRVKLTHLGWKEGAEWDKAFLYFTRAWDIVMGSLARRFAHSG